MENLFISQQYEIFWSVNDALDSMLYHYYTSDYLPPEWCGFHDFSHFMVGL